MARRPPANRARQAEYRRPPSHPGPAAQAVAEQVTEEEKVVLQIPRAEAPRLRAQPIDPGQSKSLHPKGRVGFHAGIDVKRESDRQDYAAAEQMLVLLDPRLLLRRAESNPNEIRRKPLEVGHEFRLRVTFEEAVRVALAVKRTNKFDAWIEPLEHPPQSRAAFLRAAQKIVGKIGRHPGQEFPHKRRSIHAI